MIFDPDRWIEIWVTITRNKTRSLLTCFGVFWGILMLVILLGSGAGMRNGIMSNFKGIATNSIFIMTDRTSEPYKGFNKGRWWYMRNRDIDNIKQNVRGILDISPLVWGYRSEKNVVYGQQAGTYNVKGVAPGYYNIETQEIFYGRLLNEIDIQEKRKVCLIGLKVYETFFKKNEDPCGKYIRVNSSYYQIVGVVKQIASNISIGGRSEECVQLPYTTLQQIQNQGDKINFVAVNIKHGVVVQQVIDEISTLLKAQNEISPTDPQAVYIINLSKQFEAFAKLFIGIEVLIWIVGIGTLLAGIIGVSNIMMITIKERTKEIGVRRALGAKPYNIMSQVMSESLLLTSLAGLIGLSFGVFLLDFFYKLLIMLFGDEISSFFLNPEISIQVAVAATIIIIISGLIAGLIPAWRALQIKAIDAIREE